MARATKAEIAGRIEEIVPLLLDGLRVREIRASSPARQAGAHRSQRLSSSATWRRPTARSQARPAIDRSREVASARLRYERALARSAAGRRRREPTSPP